MRKEKVEQLTITNVFGYYNKGDAAIFKSQLGILDKVYPKAKKNATCRFPHLEKNLYKDVNFFELIMSNTESNRLKRKLYLLRNLIGMFIVIYINEYLGRIFLPKSKIDALKAIKKSDVIYGCGGGYLHDSTYSYIPPLLELKYAQKQKKKIVLMGQTIGPFNTRLGRFIAKNIINNCEILLVREEWSKKHISEVLKTPLLKIKVIPDLAFSLEKINKENALNLLDKEGVKLNKPIVGLTVRDWHFPGHSDPKSKLENYVGSVVKLINFVTEELDYQVVLFPQVISPDTEDDDRNTSKIIRDRVLNKQNVYVLENDYDPSELKGMINLCKVFVGTRMHSNIFALGCRVPTIAISYLPKTEGIMGMVNQQKYVKSINDVSFAWLKEQFIDIINNEQKIREELEIYVENIEKKLQNLPV